MGTDLSSAVLNWPAGRDIRRPTAVDELHVAAIPIPQQPPDAGRFVDRIADDDDRLRGSTRRPSRLAQPAASSGFALNALTMRDVIQTAGDVALVEEVAATNVEDAIRCVRFRQLGGLDEERRIGVIGRCGGERGRAGAVSWCSSSLILSLGPGRTASAMWTIVRYVRMVTGPECPG